MESVAGFINEVQAFSQPATDPRSQVTWARFEQADINDPSLYTESSFDANGNSLPLLLVLGYTQGVQVWLIPGSGEAKLVLSLFHGQVRKHSPAYSSRQSPNWPWNICNIMQRI